MQRIMKNHSATPNLEKRIGNRADFTLKFSNSYKLSLYCAESKQDVSYTTPEVENRFEAILFKLCLDDVNYTLNGTIHVH